MKLLFDQNLPHRFVRSFGDLFPGSRHVKDLGLVTASDRVIWDRARRSGFAIVSKDSDFRQLSFLLGAPPKVIWLRCGNVSTAMLELVLRSNKAKIARFEKDADAALLLLERLQTTHV